MSTAILSIRDRIISYRMFLLRKDSLLQIRYFLELEKAALTMRILCPQ